MGTENNLFALRYVYIYIYYQLVLANYSISWIGKSRMRLLSHRLVLAIGYDRWRFPSGDSGSPGNVASMITGT